jgi:flavodoxin I
MGQAIKADVKRPTFGELTSAELCQQDLLIVGSPTQEGRVLPSLNALLENIPENGLFTRKVAAFDTRHKWKFIRIWGYAAPHIDEMLRLKGGSVVAPPEGFFVDTTKGPVRMGELERAVAWARSVVQKAFG